MPERKRVVAYSTLAGRDDHAWSSQVTLFAASRNMHSASEHPEVVQAYLGRAAGPSPMPHEPVRGHPQGPEHGEVAPHNGSLVPSRPECQRRH